MPEGTSWEFELLDKASQAAGKIAHSIRDLGERFEKGAFTLKGFERASEGGLASLRNWVAAGAVAGVVGSAMQAVEGLTEKIVELGMETAKELVHAADFERTNEAVFKAIRGSVDGAKNSMEAMNDVAQKGAIPIKDLAPAWIQLANAGFDDTKIRKLVAMSKDMSLLTGGARSMQSFASSIASMQNAGTMAGRGLLQFRDVANLDVLARKLLGAGHSAKDLAGAFKDAKISADAVLPALAEGVLAKAHESALGDLSSEVAGGWEGAMTRIENAWHGALGEFSKTQAFQDLIDMAQNFAKTLGKPETALVIKDIATSMISIAKSLAGLLPDLSSFLDGWKKTNDTVSSLRKKNEDFYAGKGFFEKTFGAGPNSQGMEGIGSGTLKNVREETGTHSPSTEFMKIGEGWAQGLAIGFSKGGGLGLPQRGLPAVSGGGGGGNRHLTLNVNVHATGNPEAHALAEAVSEEVLSAMTGAFEELAIEAGG